METSLASREPPSGRLCFAACLFCFAAILMTQGCVTTQQPIAKWSGEEHLAKYLAKTIHWGQPGESVPNKGWSDYRRFTIARNNGKVMIFQREGEGIFVDVQRHEGTSEYTALFLPRLSGMIHRSVEPQPSPCAPDSIEYLGFYAEALQFMLSRAFPDGPDSVTGSTQVNASGGPVELRFMAGVFRLKSGWKAVGTVTRTPDNDLKYRMEWNGIVFSGTWSNRPQPTLIADGEPIAGWESCPPELACFGTVGALLKAHAANAGSCK